MTKPLKRRIFKCKLKVRECDGSIKLYDYTVASVLEESARRTIIGDVMKSCKSVIKFISVSVSDDEL